MLFQEMHMKTMTNDRSSDRLREAEVHRFTKKNRRSSSMADATGKVAVAVRNAVSVLSVVQLKSVTLLPRLTVKKNG
jgi:hypothetical protein